MGSEHEFSRVLRSWYRDHRRSLPWRDTTDPYRIWLSEVILQQTRVDQGLPYYQRFIEAFPDVASLAQAPEQQVLRLWQGLGYYSRARNLHEAANQVLKLHQGRFPCDYQAIRSLKGVGDYTAAAIASFAYSLPHPVVDGNVYRFLSRLFGIYTPIDSNSGKKEYRQLAQTLLDPAHAAEHNQAIMEMGAMVCKPRNPCCGACPFMGGCHALAFDRIDALPVKGKKQKVTIRHLDYFFINDGVETLVKQRSEKDIWQGLYELPLLESPTGFSPFSEPPVSAVVEISDFQVLGPPISLRHQLTHRELQVNIWNIKVPSVSKIKAGYSVCELSRLDLLPFPRLLVRFFQSLGLL